MSKYIDVGKQLVRLYRLGLSCEDVVKQFLLTAPAEDVQEVRHGRWVTLDDEYIDECKCSSCGVLEYFNKGWKRFNYCPNCGSRMDLDGDTE